MNFPIRFSGFPGISDIKDYLAIVVFLLNSLKLLYDLSQKLGTRKFISFTICLGSILVSSYLAYVCLEGNANIYKLTGFIWPFVTPALVSPPHLTYNEASIFGHFTSIFALGLIGASMGIMIGILGFIKLLRKKLNGYSCYQ